MALGVRRVMAADLGVSTTGVAGPDRQGGRPVGTVFIAVSAPGIDEVREYRFDGDRASIRAASVAAAIDLVSAVLSRSGGG
jgi:nicotinamide-nucleotide amidase